MDQVVILAGGHGSRMKAAIPKPMLEVLGVPMLGWVVQACEAADLRNICVVTGYKSQFIEHYLNNKYKTVLQAERLGTGHAVMQAVPVLEENPDGNTLVLCGDAPFMDSETIQQAYQLHTAQGNAVTVITAKLDNPFGYGRILRSETGIAAIVEEKDATDAQRQIQEVNSGAYWFRTADLLTLLKGLSQSNVQGEYYLTDTIGLALEQGKKAGAYLTDNTDVVLGANTRKDLHAGRCWRSTWRTVSTSSIQTVSSLEKTLKSEQKPQFCRAHSSRAERKSVQEARLARTA